MWKISTALLTLFFLSLPSVSLAEESDDEKSYWGRYDNGSWALTTVTDKPANFTFGWELPEANATKEAFEAERFNKDTLSPVNNSSVNFITQYGYSGNNSFYTHITESDSQIIYGRTTSTILIGSELLSPSEGKNNLCILAKANIQHEITWVKKLYEDKSNCWISGVASNQSEEIIVVGDYTNDQSKVIGFLKKFDSSGNLIFSKTYEGSGDTYVNRVKTSSNSELIFNVRYRGNIVIDGKEYSSRQKQIYSDLLIKTDNAGNTLWINNISSTGDSYFSFDVNSNDEIVVGGRIHGSLYINSYRAYMYNSSNYGSKWQSTLLAKFDSNGDLIWTKEVYGSTANYINELAIDSENNIVFVLYHTGDATIDGATLSKRDNKNCVQIGVTKKRNCSSYFIFGSYSMVKLDTNGKLLWLQEQQRTNGMQFKGQLNFDQDNNIYFMQEDMAESYYSLFNQSKFSEITYGGLDYIGDDYVDGKVVNPKYEYTFKMSLVKIDKHGNFVMKHTINGSQTFQTWATLNEYSGFISDISISPTGRIFTAIKGFGDFEFGGISKSVEAEVFEGNTYIFEIRNN